MAEGGVGAYPQVFVVDSQANYISVPSGKKPRWARVGQRFLHLLVGFTMLGLVVEGCLIYNLYKKMEEFALHESHPHWQNLSNPKASGQRGGAIITQGGHRDSNEIPTVRPHPDQVQQRPFAQLIGSSRPVGENNVVQWMHKGGETITQNMGYSNGRLLVEKEGYYYLYSKVTLNTAVECLLIQHKVMKDTKAYDQSMELMRSKSFRCRTPKPLSAKASGEEMWNSFLGGIFHLQSGDEVFVTLEDIQMMRTGTTDNFMGAFMVFP